MMVVIKTIELDIRRYGMVRELGNNLGCVWKIPRPRLGQTGTKIIKHDMIRGEFCVGPDIGTELSYSLKRDRH